jgi:hypothetical protein
VLSLTSFASQDSTLNILNTPPRIVPDIFYIDETDSINISNYVWDPDPHSVIESYSSPLDSTGYWKTTYLDSGTYVISVNLTDPNTTNITTVTINVLDVHCNFHIDYHSDTHTANIFWDSFIGNNTYSNFSLEIQDGNTTEYNLGTVRNFTHLYVNDIELFHYYLKAHDVNGTTVYCQNVNKKREIQENADNYDYQYISFPVNFFNGSYDNVLLDVISNIEYIYQVENNTYTEKYVPTDFGDIEVIRPGIPYLVRFFDPQDIRYPGTIKKNWQYNFDSDLPYNIGGGFPESIPLANISGFNSANVDWILTYDAGNWVFYNYDENIGTLTDFELHKVYFVRAKQDFQINYKYEVNLG